MSDRESEVEVLNGLEVAARPGVPLSMFELYFESIERITDRRLSLNKSNVSISLLVLAGLGAVVTWAYDKEEIRVFAALVVMVGSFLAALFCRWWWLQINDYKTLNGTKFTILNKMADSFLLAESATAKGFDPFYWEWRLAKSREEVVRWKGGFALGSTWSELVLPKSFLLAFCAISLSCFAFLMIKSFGFLSGV